MSDDLTRESPGRTDTLLLKGLGILSIAVHNFLHLVRQTPAALLVTHLERRLGGLAKQQKA